MKYLFTGNSNFLVLEGVLNWKNQFINKYGDFNLVHIKDINNENFNSLSENLFSTSFLAEKKLIILDIDQNTQEEKIEFFINNFSRIPDENIIITSYTNPDKRSKIYKFLKENFELKEFNIENENDSFSIINNKYKGKIDDNSIRLLIKYKSNNIQKINSEIEKLLILNEKINQEIIKKYIVPELEESVFLVIDDILNKDVVNAINKIKIILNDTNIYAFYNNLLANLRINIYISNLKESKISSLEITNILGLGNRGFLINKNFKISNKNLSKFYLNLVGLDKKMKTGKLIGSTEEDFVFELQKIIIKLAN